MSKKSEKKKQAESKVRWITTLLFVLFGLVLFVIFTWARIDEQSELAKTLREVTGIQLRQEPPPPPPPPQPPEPIVVDVPEPEPQPVVVVEPEPEPQPEKISWSSYLNRSKLWPKELNITVDKEVPLIYHGQIYGKIGFQSGQKLKVISFSKNGYVLGQTGGLEMEVQLSATNFNAWFEDTHGDAHSVTYPKASPKARENARPDSFEQELITQLRRWALQTYQTPMIEIGENNLVLTWNSQAREDNAVNYKQEALNVAQAYLRIHAELGGSDNYASCEIRDSNTGALLGSMGFFMPRF